MTDAHGPSSHVVFSHGKDGDPWGAKIVAMAEVARAQGYLVESVDYRGMDDPLARVQRLMQVCRGLQGSLVLVGSSLGGHVAATVANSIAVRGLFLLAPAFYMPGYEQYTPKPSSSALTIVHGWRDDIVPIDNSLRYARECRATLHVLDADHRMATHIEQIASLFAGFLRNLG